MPILKALRACDFCHDHNTDAPYIWRFNHQTLPAGTPLALLIELVEHPEWFACERHHHYLLTQNLVGMVEDKPIQMQPYFTKLYQSLIENTQRN